MNVDMMQRIKRILEDLKVFVEAKEKNELLEKSLVAWLGQLSSEELVVLYQAI